MMLNKLHAALAALALSLTVHAQYVYVDFNDTTLSLNGQIFDLDVNQDTAMDFRFMLLRDTGTTTNLIDAALVAPFDSVNGAILGQQRGLFHYADRLEVGDLIGATASWAGMSPSDEYGTIDYRFDSVHDPYSQWQAPYTDGFLGTRTEKSGQFIYGWIRMQMAADGKSFTLKDCAYQQKADSTIEAGHLWISLAEEGLAGYSWRVANGGLYLQRPGHQAPATVRIFGVNGQTLVSGTWRDEEWALPVAVLPASVVLLVVECEGQHWVERIPLL